MEKTVTARKDYNCTRCSGVIRNGQKHIHESLRVSVVDDNEDQVGIEYLNFRLHLNDRCDGRLIYSCNPKAMIKDCSMGRHEFIEERVIDDYVGCHAVWVGTGEYFCANCGVENLNQ